MRPTSDRTAGVIGSAIPGLRGTRSERFTVVRVVGEG